MRCLICGNEYSNKSIRYCTSCEKFLSKLVEKINKLATLDQIPYYVINNIPKNWEYGEMPDNYHAGIEIWEIRTEKNLAVIDIYFTECPTPNGDNATWEARVLQDY